MTPNSERDRATSDGLSSIDGMPVGARKHYASPTLQRYGDLKAMTRAVGKTGNSDGGMNKNLKNFTGA
jgi:hypothetical protein